MVHIEEVIKHNNKDDCWVIVHGKAYDVTGFLNEHPGGSAIILKYAGKDATKAFDPIHPGDTLTKYLKKEFHKGPVEGKLPKKKKAQKASAKKSEENLQSKSEPAAAANVSGNSGKVVDEYDVEYDEQEGMLPIGSIQGSETDKLLGKGSSTVSENDSNGDDDDDDDDDDSDDEEEDLKRKDMIKRMPDISQIYNLNDFEFVARHTMEKTAWGYYSSGCDDEITLRSNHLLYHKIYFKPRVLVDVSAVDTSTTMLGTKVAAPFYFTATALGKLGHPEGEVVITRAAKKGNIVQMIPTLASCLFDEIVDAATDDQTQWLQLYVNSDREICKSIVQHAESRGIKGLFITVDAPQLGRREKDMRLKNFEDTSHVQESEDDIDRSQGAARAISSFIDTKLNWNDIAWFRSITKMPILLKGILTVEDAVLAAEHKVDGIVISNHGGRQLEFSRAPIEILAETMPVLKAKGVDLDKFLVFVDGGVRRATDILKAICLGAKGVGLGRPVLYAMSTYGEEGIRKLTQILIDELVMNMRLLGVTSIDQLNEDYVDARGLLSPGIFPTDNLFGQVYEPLSLPRFKEAKQAKF